MPFFKLSKGQEDKKTNKQNKKKTLIKMPPGGPLQTFKESARWTKQSKTKQKRTKQNQTKQNSN